MSSTAARHIHTTLVVGGYSRRGGFYPLLSLSPSLSIEHVKLLIISYTEMASSSSLKGAAYCA